MPRYSSSKNTRMQPPSNYRQPRPARAKLVSYPKKSTSNQKPQKPLWKNPLLGLSFAIAVIILFYPIWLDSRTTKLLSIHATDASDSGIANPEIPKSLCKARADNLISGDSAINFDFSDRAEITGSEAIDNNTDLSKQCQTLFTNGKERPREISKKDGTDPISIITRIQNVITYERPKGNKNAVLVTIYLDAAEPVPGKPAYDFDDFQKRIESIVSDRGKVAIIGTTGELNETLVKRFKENPAISLCTSKNGVNCINEAFKAARNQNF